MKYPIATIIGAFLVGLHHTQCFATKSAFQNPSAAAAAASVTAAAMSTKGVCEEDSTTITQSSSLSTISEANLEILSSRGRSIMELLMEDGSQEHVYQAWPEAGVDDAKKIQLAEQLADLDESYPGGILTYIKKAQVLLAQSAAGHNPFEEYTASVPTGEILTYNPSDDVDGGMTFDEAEQLGLSEIGNSAFVLVAGGLGERLGYSGIKLSLETNLCTNSNYLRVYVNYIQAMQRMAEQKMGKEAGSVKIPLVIMTSGDTDAKTRELLAANNNFGMEDGQIQIVTQDKVPALMNSDAALSMKGSYEVETKPHGHGDVHHLLLKHGHAEAWLKEGRKYVIFLQDTNALVVNGILPTLGVSIQNEFHMNSICIPRFAGEASGAITKLTHNTDPDKNLVINVEYNQLDPLLSTQGDKLGDVADEVTGYSPYPGNANNLVMELESYVNTLHGEDQGVVVEFVNPKYKDSTRTDFKKPTRLECMMQDFPKLLQKEMGQKAKVGFTQLERWFSFSPAKNSLESGIDSVKSGSTAPGTMSSAESDKYLQNQRKLAYAGVSIPSEGEELVSVGGIPVTPGPRVILSPSFAITQSQIKEKVTGGGSISTRSSLVVDGEEVTLNNLQLDGALVIKASYGCKVMVDGLKIQNKGWELVELPNDDDSIPEEVSIRGYTMEKYETAEYIITEPGNYVIGEDGILNKMD